MSSKKSDSEMELSFSISLFQVNNIYFFFVKGNTLAVDRLVVKDLAPVCKKEVCVTNDNLTTVVHKISKLTCKLNKLH